MFVMRAMRSLLCFLLPLALVACKRAPEPTADAAPKTAVTLLHYFTSSVGDNLQQLTNNFNAKNPSYELKPLLLQRTSFKSAVQNSFKVGHPSDLYSSWAGQPTASLVGDLAPIDELWQNAKLDERFPPELVQAASVYQGHKYLIPLTRYDVVFIYNKKLFDAQKLTPPRTWTEFLAVCAAFKAKGVTPISLGAKSEWPTQLWFDMLLLRTAPLSFREQLMQGRARYDDPRVMAVFARWASLLDKGYFNPDAMEQTWYKGASQMVFRGDAAMTLMGGWAMDYVDKSEEHWILGQDYDFFAFPRIRDDLPMVSSGSVDGLILPKLADNKAGAQQVLTYLSDWPQQQALIQHTGALAANLQVPRSAYSETQQHLFDVVNQHSDFVFMFDLATPSEVADMGLDAFQEFLALPKAYPRILHKLAQDAASYFQANTPS
jgi:ABC-type glycerol-3-phosphate transport system substrate-binding protein